MAKLKRYPAYFLLFIAFCFISGASCDRDKPKPGGGNTTIPKQLPPATTSGANTFGCKVNGQVWLPGVPPGLVAKLNADYLNGKFFVRAVYLENLDDDPGEWMSINANCCLFTDGRYQLTEYYNDYMGIYIDSEHCPDDYQTDSLNNSWVEFTRLDTINRVASGIFEMILVNPGCDTVRITEGRFDVRI